MPRARLLLPALAIAAALALTACGGADKPAGDAAPAPTTAAPAPAPGADCEGDTEGGTPVRFGPGETLGGVSFGSGAKAVVLIHQVSSSLCQWAPYAKELAGAGYLALAIDAPRTHSSRNATVNNAEAVAEAAAHLRATGATGVVLLGASMGGTAVLAAAVQAAPPVNGVIALSPPTYFDGTDALALMPKLAVPALIAAGDGDGQFASNAEKLSGAIPAGQDSELLILNSGGHGVNFTETGYGEAAEKVRGAIDKFLAAHLPG